MDLVKWLDKEASTLTACEAERLRIFAEHYANQPSWPVLALPAAVAELYGIPSEQQQALVAGSCLFFLAADIIDDAQDGDLDNESSWPFAINAGLTFLFGAIRAFAAAAPHAPVAQEVSMAGNALVQGQELDLHLTWQAQPEEDTVLAAVNGKSGASMALYLRMAAHAAERMPVEVEKWGLLGQTLGMAIQLRSDLNDLSRPASRDFRARKLTLPLAYGMKRSPEALKKAMEDDNQAAAWRALRSCGAITFVEFKIDALLVEAETLIAAFILAENDRKRLLEFIHSAIAIPMSI
ncbi:MAG: polyprenyl synthetase family protein [Cyanobacteria bacterium NC_groundwater_1444_Ag_S-0.65um_54_12]|nr:polyprenyl synthetase family protein [Cyanobacteria bacterium NC_groundwater_1444_Ag_S-0.65um_54_12]